MKMRNSMKIWINRWFVLRSGKLIYFRDDKDMLCDRCVGILRLADCKIERRPPNKDGYSFKIYHLLRYSIYHKYGLRGETLKLASLPVSWNYCLLRVSSEQECNSWIDAISTQIERTNCFDVSNVSLVPKTAILDDLLFTEEATSSGPQSPLMISNAMNAAVTVDEEKKEVHLKMKANELAENLFQKNEALQKNLMRGLDAQHKHIIKSLEKRIFRMLYQWKADIATRMDSLRDRLNKTLQQRSVQQEKQRKKIVMSYLQFVGLVLICILLGRII